MDPSIPQTSTQPILTQCQNCLTWQPVNGFTLRDCPRRKLYERLPWACSIFDTLTGPMPSGQLRMTECPPPDTTGIRNQEQCISVILPLESGFTLRSSGTSLCSSKWECSRFSTCLKHGFTRTTAPDRSLG